MVENGISINTNMRAFLIEGAVQIVGTPVEGKAAAALNVTSPLLALASGL